MTVMKPKQAQWHHPDPVRSNRYVSDRARVSAPIGCYRLAFLTISLPHPRVISARAALRAALNVI